MITEISVHDLSGTCCPVWLGGGSDQCRGCSQWFGCNRSVHCQKISQWEASILFSFTISWCCSSEMLPLTVNGESTGLHPDNSLLSSWLRPLPCSKKTPSSLSMWKSAKKEEKKVILHQTRMTFLHLWKTNGEIQNNMAVTDFIWKWTGALKVPQKYRKTLFKFTTIFQVLLSHMIAFCEKQTKMYTFLLFIDNLSLHCFRIQRRSCMPMGVSTFFSFFGGGFRWTMP